MIMNNLKAKIATRLMGGVAVGFAAVLSMTPMTAFAGGFLLFGKKNNRIFKR